MFLSVLICTRDRSASLERVLISLSKMTVPEQVTWELLVVDNGSKDETPKIIADFADKLPIRHIFEPRAGLSRARNCGVSAVKGDYILWTDDDVEVDPGWIAAYSTAILRYPEASVFGGKISAILEEPTPVWFASSTSLLAGLLAVRDFGDDDVPISTAGDRLPFGANFVVRSIEQRQHVYDTELGVSPGKRRVGEETQVIVNILKDGGVGYLIAEAQVKHLISAARQTTGYVFAYFRGYGETLAFQELFREHRSPFILLAYHGYHALANAVLLNIFKPFLPPRWWVPRLKSLGFHTGALDYIRKNLGGHQV